MPCQDLCCLECINKHCQESDEKSIFCPKLSCQEQFGRDTEFIVSKEMNKWFEESIRVRCPLPIDTNTNNNNNNNNNNVSESRKKHFLSNSIDIKVETDGKIGELDDMLNINNKSNGKVLLNCNYECKLKELETHMKNCDYRSIECEQCNEWIISINKQYHLEIDCIRTEKECPEHCGMFEYASIYIVFQSLFKFLVHV